MNYYEHHLGDWAAATGHLSWDEDMAYTRLLRAYYHAERPISDGQQYRLAKASSPSQRKAVDAVLAEFFELRDGAWRQKRADTEIERYHDKQRKAKASANVRWSQSERNANASKESMRTHSERISKEDANALPTQSDGNALQTPDTRHQTPGNTGKPARKRAAPAGAACPEDVAESVWRDWTELRRVKRATVTPTVIAEARSEADKAGMTLEAFLRVWCARGSQGLQADWLRPNERTVVVPINRQEAQEQRNDAAARAWLASGEA